MVSIAGVGDTEWKGIGGECVGKGESEGATGDSEGATGERAGVSGEREWVGEGGGSSMRLFDQSHSPLSAVHPPPTPFTAGVKNEARGSGEEERGSVGDVPSPVVELKRDIVLERTNMRKRINLLHFRLSYNEM